jgi:hypothetical protein
MALTVMFATSIAALWLFLGKSVFGSFPGRWIPAFAGMTNYFAGMTN